MNELMAFIVATIRINKMRIFSGLEGARGLLAIAVVIAHVVQLTGLKNHTNALNWAGPLGNIAVRVFIILSGFVIFHLLMGRDENYGTFITRRFFRLYPVYFACLCIGLVATALTFSILPGEPWGDALPVSSRMLEQIRSVEGYGYATHLFAHLTMMHGAISSNVLYESQYFFIPPAWSLSLEWQFYLVAPFAFQIMRTIKGIIFVCAVSAALFIAYNRHVFGSFILPSFLPGALPLFAIGIASRMLLRWIELRPKSSGAAAIVVSLAVALHEPTHSEFLIWAMIFFYSLGTFRAITSAFRFLDAKPIVALGARSYPLYLVHFPIIQLLLVASASTSLSYSVMTLSVVIAALPVSLAAADLLHRFIEKPGMAVGRQLTTA